MSTHSLALSNEGTVLAWGGNGSGQATVPAGLTAVTAVAAGSNHNLALKVDGTVVAWGDDSYGQATVPAGITTATQVAAGEKAQLGPACRRHGAGFGGTIILTS